MNMKALLKTIATASILLALATPAPAGAAPGARTWTAPYASGASGDLSVSVGPAYPAVGDSSYDEDVRVLDTIGPGRTSVTYTATVSVSHAVATGDGRALLEPRFWSAPAGCESFCLVRGSVVTLARDGQDAPAQVTTTFRLELDPYSPRTSLPAGEYGIGVGLIAAIEPTVAPTVGQPEVWVPCMNGSGGTCRLTIPPVIPTVTVSTGVGSAEGAVHVDKITR